MSDILVIKCNVYMRDKQMDDLYDHIKSQMEDGLVVLPPYCEAIFVPENVEVGMSYLMDELPEKILKTGDDKHE